VEDRISGFKDKKDIKKTEDYLEKRLQIYERNMQKFCDSIETPNLRILDIKEGEEVKVKCIENIFNKIMHRTSQTLRKRCPYKYRKSQEHQTDMNKMEPLHGIS
jgi:predicted DNA-binding antitoxin AbrB/MazE fold protein